MYTFRRLFPTHAPDRLRSARARRPALVGAAVFAALAGVLLVATSAFAQSVGGVGTRPGELPTGPGIGLGGGLDATLIRLFSGDAATLTPREAQDLLARLIGLGGPLPLPLAIALAGVLAGMVREMINAFRSPAQQAAYNLTHFQEYRQAMAQMWRDPAARSYFFEQYGKDASSLGGATAMAPNPFAWAIGRGLQAWGWFVRTVGLKYTAGQVSAGRVPGLVLQEQREAFVTDAAGEVAALGVGGLLPKTPGAKPQRLWTRLFGKHAQDSYQKWGIRKVVKEGTKKLFDAVFRFLRPGSQTSTQTQHSPTSPTSPPPQPVPTPGPVPTPRPPLDQRRPRIQTPPPQALPTPASTATQQPALQANSMAKAQEYERAITTLQVESNERYRKNRQGRGETYCNIFVADVTKALGVPIPEFVRDGNGQIVNYLDANEMQDWLLSNGPSNRWRRVSADEAQQLANQGCPTVASWKNPGGRGHIAIVRPGPEPVPDTGPRIAQAGLYNYESTDAATGFRAQRLPELMYFVNG